ncbi:MAG: hypothetical protein AB9858_05620 [Acidaminococcaceae bacterium]
MLRPNETVQKLIISSTSRFIGEYESANLLITHAWQNSLGLKIGYSENPYCRNYYEVVFKTEPIEHKPGIIIPNYSYMGDFYCICLSIFYGKRFDNHGTIENMGSFQIPNLFGTSIPTSYFEISFNNHQPRKDLSIELNFEKIALIADIISMSIDENILNVIISAGRFYTRALQTFETEPELAFLDFITCGEILSNSKEYNEDEMFSHDVELLKIFNSIETGIENGSVLSSRIKKRLFQIKRKYTLTLCGLLNEYFFTNTESTISCGALTKNNIETSIKASYDLRSQYVHTGVNFGNQVLPIGNMQNEIVLGTPCGIDSKLANIIHKSPTLIGMERIMRFCLLRYIQLASGVIINSKLD